MTAETPGQAACVAWNEHYAAQQPQPAPGLAAERDRFWNALFYIACRAPEYVPHAGPECVQVAKDAIEGTGQPAPELAESVECDGCGLWRPPTQAERAAPELAKLRDQLGEHRAVISDMLNHFRATGNGWRASARVVELRRWYDTAGIERPYELRDAQ